MFFEHAVQVNAIEHHRSSQPDAVEIRSKVLFECSALDSQVGDCLLAVVATLAHLEIVVPWSSAVKDRSRKNPDRRSLNAAGRFPPRRSRVRKRRRTPATVENAQSRRQRCATPCAMCSSLLAAGARIRESAPGPVQARAARRDRYGRNLCDAIKSSTTRTGERSHSGRLSPTINREDLLATVPELATDRKARCTIGSLLLRRQLL
jgi:hypothetical protein